MKSKLFKLEYLLLFAFSCNHMASNNDLNQKDIKYIQSLKLLDENEQIYMYYSEYNKKVAGNFFTNKKIATYWIDARDENNNEISFAFYKDIKSIDTFYYAGLTYTPYMLITKHDGSQFKVSVDGDKEKIKLFFEEAIRLWNNNK